MISKSVRTYFLFLVLFLACRQPTTPSLPEILGTKIVTGGAPSISPDGTMIVFKRSDSGNLFLCDSGGHNLEQLTDGSNSDNLASWSPSGQEVAFIRYSSGLMAVNVQSKSMRSLLPVGSISYPTMLDHLIWSPNGDKIAYFEDSLSTRTIKIISSDGTGMKKADFICDAFCWTSNPEQFISTFNYPDSAHLHRGDLISETITRLPIDDFLGQLMCLSDGTTLIYRNFRDQFIYFNLQSLTVSDLLSAPYYLPAISPDGRKLAYLRNVRSWSPDYGPYSKIVCIDKVTDSSLELTAFFESTTQFTWSPNSKDIYYYYHDAIYKVSLP